MTHVLFARSDSIYKSLPGCDVWDAERDARRFTGSGPVIAHPPCGQWGRLRQLARSNPEEKALALLAVQLVRRNGGVLEHPASSSLWPVAGLPRVGRSDARGGFTVAVHQSWWGHRAEKRTWLYIVGLRPDDLPAVPLKMGDAPCVIETKKKGDVRPSIGKAEREHTPHAFATWLCQVAQAIQSSRSH